MKYIFLFSDASDSHNINRVEDFVRGGCEVEVFSFIRKGRKIKSQEKVPMTILGEIEDGNYINRLFLYYKSIKKIVEKYKKEDVVYYTLGLHIAFFIDILSKGNRFIYEEADLVHTYFKVHLLKLIFEKIDKRIIRNSYLTFLTSEGFALYHFGNFIPDNVRIVTNRLNPSIQDCELERPRLFNSQKICIGFVGLPRFDSVYNFIDCFCSNFPQFEFHIFGAPMDIHFEELMKYNNCICHGRFSNPNDLPQIYSSIDLVLCTYDIKYDNVRYAEPNKIYEAIYFRKPIIVSDHTYLGNKVKALNIGYVINALDNSAIISFINSLSLDSINEKICSCNLIPKCSAINDNSELISKVKNSIS